jgi:hypothetical protein
LRRLLENGSGGIPSVSAGFTGNWDMDIKKKIARSGLLLVFFIIVIGLISLLIVFYPIFKSAIVNPFTDALFIFLIFLVCWFTFVTVKTIKDSRPPENNKDKGPAK